MVRACGRFDTSPHASARRFHDGGARIFYGRFRLRRRKRAKNSGRTSACPRCSASWRTRWQLCPEWNHDACDAALRGLAAAEGVKAGLLINATRVAILGRAVAPPLFETMVVLGKDRVVERLRRALPAVSAR